MFQCRHVSHSRLIRFCSILRHFWTRINAIALADRHGLLLVKLQMQRLICSFGCIHSIDDCDWSRLWRDSTFRSQNQFAEYEHNVFCAKRYLKCVHLLCIMQSIQWPIIYVSRVWVRNSSQRSDRRIWKWNIWIIRWYIRWIARCSFAFICPSIESALAHIEHKNTHNVSGRASNSYILVFSIQRLGRKRFAECVIGCVAVIVIFAGRRSFAWWSASFVQHRFDWPMDKFIVLYSFIGSWLCRRNFDDWKTR